MSSLLMMLWETISEGVRGGARLGRLNFSPSCLHVHPPGTGLHRRAALEALVLEAALLGEGWAPH